ncbi:MAG: hypothetical protein M9935_07525 [Kiritimatiellae bacterium]|nr:hypothetical protein [Kiritimatiellia bacterium]
MALEIARRRCGLTLKELGAIAGDLDYRCVATAIGRIKKRAVNDRALRTIIREVEAKVANVKT